MIELNLRDWGSGKAWQPTLQLVTPITMALRPGGKLGYFDHQYNGGINAGVIETEASASVWILQSARDSTITDKVIKRCLCVCVCVCVCVCSV